MISPYVYPALAKNIKPKKDFVIDIVLTHFDTTFDSLLAKNKKYPIVEIRRMLCYLLRNKTNMSLNEIAKIFKQDHTTIMHAINRFQSLLDIKDERIYKDYLKITNKLKGIN